MVIGSFVNLFKRSCYRKFRNINYLTYSTIPNLPKINYVPPAYKGLTYDETIHIRNTRLNPALTTFYKKPLMLTSGYMQWLYDNEGHRYLDLFGGIVTVSIGHCHPKITKVATEQLSTLCHTTNIYLHPKIHEFAEKLTDKMPGNLKIVYFVNSGSEANDLALLMAQLYTGSNEIISLRNGYHGLTQFTMGVTAMNTYKHRIPYASGIHHAMNPDVFRGPWGGKYCRDSPIQTLRTCSCVNGESCAASINYYNQIEDIFRYTIPKNNVAAFITESIQGVGGAVQFPKGFIKKTADLIRQNGGLYIADEVQTGLGRTGDHYWGFEGHNVVPDIVTMAKGLGNGFPLGAVVTTPDIAKSLTRASHFNTFGGNALASAIGSAVLDVIDEEKLQHQSKELGTYFLNQLSKLRDEFDCIGDVRGKGLMIGMEMVESKSDNQPMKTNNFSNILETLKDNRVLVGKGGLYGNVIRIKPPMCVTKEDIDYALAVFRHAIEKHQK